MAHFVRHQPSQWRFARAESVEHRSRRMARQKQMDRVDRARSSGTGLWWCGQRYVDQVVPSSFVNPDHLDTFNYRYQVFARPSSVQPKLCSLAATTDQKNPLRYNVKRMAADKVWTPGCVTCAHHWEPALWQLECCPPIRPQPANSDTGHHHEVQPKCPVRDAHISPSRSYGGGQGSPPRTSNSRESSLCRDLSARKSMRNEVCTELVNTRLTPKVAQLFAHPLEPEHNRCRDRLIAQRNKCRSTLDTVSALLVDDISSNSCPGFDGRINNINNNSCVGFDGRVDEDGFNMDELMGWDTDAPREFPNDVPGFSLPPLLPPVGWCQNKVPARCGQNDQDQRPQCVPGRHSQNMYWSDTTDEASRTHCNELLGHLEGHVRPRCAVERQNLDNYRGDRYPDQPVYEDAPNVGYMTSRIVGGKQYRLPPPKNYLAKVKLPPHLAEYREFCRRCPNPSLGRYDRSDPANEMLLAGHSSSVTMPSSRSPFVYTRNPQGCSYPPIFYCPKGSQLCWSLPGEVTRSH